MKAPEAEACLADHRPESAADLIASCTALLEMEDLQQLDRIDALTNRAVGYRRLKEWKQALADYNAVLAIEPSYPVALSGRGDVYFQLGDYGRAIADQDQAIAGYAEELASPGLEAGMAQDFRKAIADARAGRSLAYMKQGDYLEASRDLRLAFAEDPTNSDVTSSLCWALAVLGTDLTSAENACNLALSTSANEARILDSRGLVRLKQKRFAEAWQDYNSAATRDGQEASYFFGRGIAALGLGRRVEGEADLARAENMRPAIRREYASYGIFP